jgi:hypothetical protein
MKKIHTHLVALTFAHAFLVSAAWAGPCDYNPVPTCNSMYPANSQGNAMAGGGNATLAWTQNSVIAGGAGNTIGGTSSEQPAYSNYDAINGGSSNKIQESDTCTIDGGEKNLIAGAQASTITGGARNELDRSRGAAILGGEWNVVTADYAVTVGGLYNSATGFNSLAAGTGAWADQDGCFVWADSNASLSQQTCVVNGHSATNAFAVRSTGGVNFVTGLDAFGNPNAGVYLGAGASSWSSLSDQNAKYDVQEVDATDVLTRLISIPVATWRYRGEASAVLHMGPMAQDFYAAYRLGDDDRHIATIDADGVALAAIKALHQESTRKDGVIHALSTRVAALERANESANVCTNASSSPNFATNAANSDASRRIASLEKRLADLEELLLLRK